MKACIIATALLVVLFSGGNSYATSDRVAPASGYGAHDYVIRMTPGSDGILYAAGLDVVYANTSSAQDGRLTRCFLHVEANNSGDTIQVVLCDYNGMEQAVLCEIDPPKAGALPQTVKLDPLSETVWFSYTLYNNSDDRFYTVPWDPTLSIYPAEATYQFQLNGNWEIEWSTDESLWDGGTGPGQGGRPFFSATGGGWGNPNAVWIYDGESFQKIIDIGGHGSGFAFDNKGNLWSGTVTYSGVPEKLMMWSADDIDTAVDSDGDIVLGISGLWGDPDWGPKVVLDLPYIGESTHFIPSDIERDPHGNMYISCNAFLSSSSLINAHRIIVLENDGTAPWPQQQDMLTLAEALVVGTDMGFRALSYDGNAHIDAGGVSLPPWDTAAGNRLYADMDFGVSSENPDEVIGVCLSDDADNDGVPDGLDNCWQTENEDQIDSDIDGFGDVCEGDCDGNGKVDVWDVPFVASEYGAMDTTSGTLYAADLDGDGDVDGADLAAMISRLIP